MFETPNTVDSTADAVRGTGVLNGVRIRGAGLSIGVLMLLAASAFSPGTAAAQSTNATLSATIYDEQHRLIPGAAVSVRNTETGQTRGSVTDDNGTVYFVGLAPGRYELISELTGFAHINRDITLRISEDARVEITMRLAGLSESVHVVGADVPLIEPGRSELGTRITTRQIQDLPVAGRDFTNLALLTSGILTDQSTVSGGSGIVTAAQTGRDNAFALDGLSLIGTQSSTLRSGAPLDSIREFAVLTNGFTAEYGQASGAVVNVLTRSGTNEFASRAFFYDRDDALDATPAAAGLVVPPLAKSKLQQKVLGGFTGGPLVRNRAFFFGSLEYTMRDTDAIVTSPVRQVFSPTDPSHVPQPFRHPQVFGRTDLNLRGLNTLTLRYRYDHSSQANRGVGGNVARERGSDDVRTDEDVALLDTQVIGSRALNEFRAQRSRWDFGFDTTNYCYKCPTINRPDIMLGGSGWSRRLEDRWQLADSYTYVVPNGLGSHTFKAGLDLSLITHKFIGLPNSDGIFHFATDLPFDPANPMTYPDQYKRAQGADVVQLAHNTYALFIQDRWKARPDLTVNVGARWEYDTGPGISRDRDNVAPRVGVTFDPWKDGRTAVRGSYGVYYDAFYLALARMAAQSQTAVTIVLANPGYPDPYGPNEHRTTGPVIPPLSIQQLASDMETPYTEQATLGFERALGSHLAMTADGVWARGRHLIFSHDHNYPDLDSPLIPKPRPNPALQSILVFETAGHSSYRGLHVALRSVDDDRHYAFSVAYTWSTSLRDTEDFGFVAQDQRNQAAEWGPSLSDVRHRFAASFSARLASGLHVATIVSAQSALPYNVTTGRDDNSDTFLTDRPVGVSRNSRRGDDFWQTDVRLTKELRVAGRRVELLIEAFNVLNQSNWIGYNGNRVALGFGKPTSSTDPRQVQLGVRVDF